MSRTADLRFRVVHPVLAIVMPLMVCAVALEAALRVAGTRSPVAYPEMYAWRAGSPLLPYSLRPNFKGTYAGGIVTVGADGNRIVTSARKPAAASGGEVVLLGDSVTFGQGLDDDQTIASQLQPALASPVVSIAAPGYTSWNEYAALELHLKVSKPRAVVLVYVINDITRDNDHFKLSATGGRLHYMETTAFHKLTRFLYDHSRSFYLVSDSIKRLVHMIRRDGPEVGNSYREFDRGVLDYSLEALGKIAAACVEVGAQFAVAIYREGPHFQTEEAREAVMAYERVLARELAARNIGSFALTTAVDQLSPAQFVVSWNDRNHPSAKAAGLMAIDIRRELAKRGID